MEAQSQRTRWTYAEFARLPSEGNTRYEVIAGELVVTPIVSPSSAERDRGAVDDVVGGEE